MAARLPRAVESPSPQRATIRGHVLILLYFTRRAHRIQSRPRLPPPSPPPPYRKNRVSALSLLTEPGRSGRAFRLPRCASLQPSGRLGCALRVAKWPRWEPCGGPCQSRWWWRPAVLALPLARRLFLAPAALSQGCGAAPGSGTACARAYAARGGVAELPPAATAPRLAHTLHARAGAQRNRRDQRGRKGEEQRRRRRVRFAPSAERGHRFRTVSTTRVLECARRAEDARASGQARGAVNDSAACRAT